MSKESKIVPKDVYYDIDGVRAILLSRGVNKSLEDIANEMGYTDEGLRKLRKKGTQAAASLLHFAKENMLRIEDIVKEVDSKK